MYRNLAVLLLAFIVATAHAQNVKTANDVLAKHGLGKSGMVAQDYNAAGFKVYQKGDLNDAIALFKEAIRLDPGHVLANYNLSCVLSLTTNGRPYNEITEELSQIIQYLGRAIERDPARRLKAIKDKDFDPIRDTMEFKVITAAPGKPVVETRKMRFKDINVFEYDLKLIFTDANGKDLWFSDSAGVFRGLGLFSMTVMENGFPDYRVNKDAQGLYFDVTWQWSIGALGESGFSGAVTKVINATMAR